MRMSSGKTLFWMWIDQKVSRPLFVRVLRYADYIQRKKIEAVASIM